MARITKITAQDALDDLLGDGLDFFLGDGLGEVAVEDCEFVLFLLGSFLAAAFLIHFD